MKHPNIKIHIGLRTVKTAAAIIIAMLIVDALGTTDSKLIFAMLGAMTAVQPTFKESVESSLSQIIGVVFGALVGVLLLALKLPSLITIGIGIILVITLYNTLHIRFSPSLPCFIVVMLCTAPEVNATTYAIGRVWDTTIGLCVGMAINMLVFPYDNSRQIRETAKSLDTELIAFLEDMFDGDENLPDSAKMQQAIDTLSAQLRIFSNQKLLLKLKRQKQELNDFQSCCEKARALVAQMEVLHAMGRPGGLSTENRNRLEQIGAVVADQRVADPASELDIVTNYHVSQILTLRQELLEALKSNQKE